MIILDRPEELKIPATPSYVILARARASSAPRFAKPFPIHFWEDALGLLHGYTGPTSYYHELTHR
jgi:hypothetical protein